MKLVWVWLVNSFAFGLGCVFSAPFAVALALAIYWLMCLPSMPALVYLLKAVFASRSGGQQVQTVVLYCVLLSCTQIDRCSRSSGSAERGI